MHEVYCIAILSAAGDAARVAVLGADTAAGDLTRAVDVEVVAGRLSTLSEVVGIAGAAELGAASAMGNKS